MATTDVPALMAGGGKRMGKLSSKQRKALPKQDFAVPSKAPGSGSYPMPDRAHAANAKARAAQFAPPAVKAKVDAKANAILKKGKKP
jgi:hypothetical protein